MTKAAKAAHISRSTHYDWLETDLDYEKAFRQAEQTFADLVRDEVRRRAIDGWDEPVIYQGKFAQQGRGKNKKPVIIHKFSDRLLELLAKAKCEEFREKHEITGAGGGALELELISRLTTGRDRLAKRNPAVNDKR